MSPVSSHQQQYTSSAGTSHADERPQRLFRTISSKFFSPSELQQTLTGVNASLSVKPREVSSDLPFEPEAGCRTFSSLAQKPKEIQVETFRIDYHIRTPKVEKLSLQPISLYVTISLTDSFSLYLCCCLYLRSYTNAPSMQLKHVRHHPLQPQESKAKL